MAKAPKVCFFEEKAMQKIKNGSKKNSTGFEKLKMNSANRMIKFKAQLSRENVIESIKRNSRESKPAYQTFGSSINKHTRVFDMKKLLGHDQRIFQLTVGRVQYDANFEVNKTSKIFLAIKV